MKTKLLIGLIVVILIAGGVAAYAAYQKYTELQNEMNLKQGIIDERDRSLMEANEQIGRLNSVISTERGLKEAANALLEAERGEWADQQRKYKWRIESLTTANAELKTKLDNVLGGGGVFFPNDMLEASSSDALTQVKEILVENGVTLGWEFIAPNRRVVVRTENVFEDPPRASVETNQHFRIDQLIVRTRTGVKQNYMRLFETTPDGEVIARMDNIKGDFRWEPESPKWYDRILAGFRVGAEVDRDSNVRLPLYGQIGYQHLKGVPWAITVDPYIAIDGREDEEFRLDYGAGLYFHLRKP